MAKLYFNFAAMNAGKSTILLQASHNYHERGMTTVMYTADLDDRYGRGKITSRIGITSEANTFQKDTNLFEEISDMLTRQEIDCVLVDEAQFLSEAQVWQLSDLADKLGIPVMCYGLRSDFQGKLFPGSAALLAVAEDLREIRTICWCGRKATMNLRLDAEGNAVTEGEQVVIGGEESYISVCRKHWATGQTKSANTDQDVSREELAEALEAI